PGWNLLQPITPELLNNGQDRVLLETTDYRLQEFDGYLCLVKTSPWFDSVASIKMDLVRQKSVTIPNNGALKIRRELGVGLSDRFSQVELRFRDGSEELKLPGRPTKSLKKLFQEQRIQPWVRERIPLVFVGDELVCVPGIGVAESAQAKPEEQGFILEWAAPEF
ncbi:MAG: tRNA lysidine(34) synthetase TilS, partial [Pseudomonadales bacterium]|nr:tRNA lysidine(34) synthetase TilS [Pseudomonadales bacterium]